MARCASSSRSSQRTRPRACPVAMSRTTLTVSTGPVRLKSSWSSASPASGRKISDVQFSTDELLLFACGDYRPRTADLTIPNGVVGGFRLELSRRSGGASQRRLVTPTSGTARGKIRYGILYSVAWAPGVGAVIERAAHPADDDAKHLSGDPHPAAARCSCPATGAPAGDQRTNPGPLRAWTSARTRVDGRSRSSQPAYRCSVS